VTKLNETRFGDLQPSCVVLTEANTVLYTTTRRSLNTENGKLFSVSFQIPENAVPGTVYTLSFTSPEMRGETQSALPLLTGKGKITVSPDAAVTTAPVVEIFAPPTATTAVTSTTAASSAEVPAVTTEVTAAPTETTTTTTTVLTVAPYLYHGIDISAWQKGADFSKIAEDPQVDFVILRAGYGKYLKQKDECFDSFYNDAKKYNIPVGAYWYSYAMTPEEARLEADICAQAIAGKKFEYPIAFDIEEPKQLALPVEEVSALIDAFCSEMEKKGYYAQVYCSSFYLNTRVNNYVKERYDVWCAHYNVKRPTFTGKYNIWQYSHTGTVSGVPGDCDLDYCYHDYPEIIKRLHFNGF
jgi:GH25 family lysozyme M1 (1,4-beta-N-acetylmuramidase)